MTNTTSNIPSNPNTERAYKGENAEILLQAAQERGYSSNEWATLKQWNAMNECVSKNQKGTKIVFQTPKGEVVAFLFNRNQLIA